MSRKVRNIESNSEKMDKLIKSQNDESSDKITDEEFIMVLNALFGPYKGPGLNFE